MDKKRPSSQISIHRRRWGFTQAEIAFMLGLRGNPQISRLEDGDVDPPLEIAFGLQVIFGADARQLFPALFDRVEEEVLTRAYELYERLQGSKARLVKPKLDFLEGMFERAKHRHDLDI